MTLSVFLLPLAVWTAWIPSPEEPAYVFVTAWGEKGSAPGQFNDPTGIAVSDNGVFVSDARIQVFDYNDRFRRQFGSKGDGGRDSLIGRWVYRSALTVSFL